MTHMKEQKRMAQRVNACIKYDSECWFPAHRWVQHQKRDEERLGLWDHELLHKSDAKKVEKNLTDKWAHWNVKLHYKTFWATAWHVSVACVMISILCFFLLLLVLLLSNGGIYWFYNCISPAHWNQLKSVKSFHIH